LWNITVEFRLGVHIHPRRLRQRRLVDNRLGAAAAVGVQRITNFRQDVSGPACTATAAHTLLPLSTLSALSALSALSTSTGDTALGFVALGFVALGAAAAMTTLLTPPAFCRTVAARAAAATAAGGVVRIVLTRARCLTLVVSIFLGSGSIHHTRGLLLRCASMVAIVGTGCVGVIRLRGL